MCVCVCVNLTETTTLGLQARLVISTQKTATVNKYSESGLPLYKILYVARCQDYQTSVCQ